MQERPAYLVVADELRQQIQSGQYPPGARLPTMEELRRFYGVSEIVIRHAVSLLRQEGLVETRRGGGTVVRARPVVRRRAMERYAIDARQARARYAGGPGTSFTEDHALNWRDYRLTARHSEVAADEEDLEVLVVEPEDDAVHGQRGPRVLRPQDRRAQDPQRGHAMPQETTGRPRLADHDR